MEDPNASITTLRAELAEMQGRAAVCQAVMGGTVAMRAAGKTYLPQWPQELDKAWEARKSCSTLNPAFKKAVKTMVGRPFGAPIGIGKDVPAKIEGMFENIDLAGRDLDSFAQDLLTTVLRDGISWVLVDYPPMPKGATALDEKVAGARPYWVHIPMRNMISWRVGVVGGKPAITHARWYECKEVQDGPWVTREVQRIKVWEPGLVQAWELRKREGSDETHWVMVEQMVVSLQEVPLVAFYGERCGFWEALPPLEDLAWLLVQHWQSSSDQRHVLHVARVPLLGADKDMRQNNQAPVELGVEGIITGFENLRYIEHTGAAIAAGRQDLVDLEDQMQRVAGELLSRQVQKTASENDTEASQNASWLKRIVFDFQDCLEECLRLTAAWIKEAEGGSLSLVTDWDEETLAADVMTALLAARQAREISRETYLYNMKQGGVMSPERTIEQEMDALDAEGPAPIPKGTQALLTTPPSGAPQPGKASSNQKGNP